MPRFVLLYHACPAGYERPSHWDLMLEVGDTLHTWVLFELPRAWRDAQLATASIDPACPAISADNTVVAEQLGHHRLAYLEYEGPLTGHRGRVHRIDSGTYLGEPTSKRQWQLELRGGINRGKVVLQRDSNDAKNWCLRLEN